jgi:hypothetical protein
MNCLLGFSRLAVFAVQLSKERRENVSGDFEGGLSACE